MRVTFLRPPRSRKKVAMLISRRFTKDSQDPFAGIPFAPRTSKIVNPNGSVVFEKTDIQVPEGWSQVAVDILAQKYFRRAGVAARTRRVGLCTLISLLVASPALAAAPTERDAQKELLKEINAARREHGRAPLKLSKVLAKPARGHSSWVARTGNLTHDGADGKPFYVRLYRAGFPRTKAVGENLGIISDCATNVAAQMVQMWLDSPAHRRVMLSPRFRVVGLGVVADADCANTAYTADFGG